MGRIIIVLAVFALVAHVFFKSGALETSTKTIIKNGAQHVEVEHKLDLDKFPKYISDQIQKIAKSTVDCCKSLADGLAAMSNKKNTRGAF